MLVDVLPRPRVERVWRWDGSAEDAAAIHAHLVDLGTFYDVTTRFLDHGDGTASVENDTYMYGSNSYPVEADRWYRTTGNWGGVEPIPTTTGEVDALYRPHPEYPVVFGTEPPNSDV